MLEVMLESTGLLVTMSWSRKGCIKAWGKYFAIYHNAGGTTREIRSRMLTPISSFISLVVL